MSEFIDEDDLKTFESWLKYQAMDVTTLDPLELSKWRRIYEQIRQSSAATRKVGLMQLRSTPGEYRYGVAVKDDESKLWLTLWVRRSAKREFFVMLPRGDREWDPHMSYHLDGNLHMKSRGQRFSSQKRQPLTDPFSGVVGLGTYYGHGPKGVGAVCDPNVFSGVVIIPVGVLGPSQGGVSVDLMEPGCEPPVSPWKNIVARQIFSDFVPNVVITVGCDHARA